MFQNNKNSESCFVIQEVQEESKIQENKDFDVEPLIKL